MRTLCLLFAAAGAAAAQDMAAAESPAKVAMAYLKRYDVNDDGHISKSEYSNSEFWKKYDGDQNGEVTAQEIRNQEEALRKKAAAAMPKRKEYFRGLDDFGIHDANGDGRLSKKELESYLHDGQDGDRNNWLSEEEYEGINKRPRGDDSQEVSLSSFQQQDADHNGKIEVDELDLPPAYLDALDRDNDRAVSKEELIEIVVAAWGGVPGLDADAVIRKYDANGDRELDKKEFEGKERLWDQINGYKPEKEDPTLSKDEIERYIGRVRELRQKANSFMTRYDFNGDGKVTKDEFDGPEGTFERCDVNGDGLITRKDGVD